MYDYKNLFSFNYYVTIYVNIIFTLQVFIQYKEHMANVSKLIDCTFLKSSICDITVYQVIYSV